MLMNLKFLVLCINAVVATSHDHHLRHEPEQHDIAFRATKSELRRLLKGEETRVLRGSPNRFLEDQCKDNETQNTWKCDKDTEDCGKNEGDCDEVCDAKKDCNDNGKCKGGKCDCDNDHKGKKCEQVRATYTYKFVYDDEAQQKSDVCQETIRGMENDLELLVEEYSLPDFVDDPEASSSKSKRNRHTLHRNLSKEPEETAGIVIVISIPINACTTKDTMANARNAIEATGLVKTKGSRDI